MPRELTPGVWLLAGARGCNVYLLDAGGTTVVIDAGLAGGAHALTREIEHLVASEHLPAPTLLLLTHAHPDHAGGAAALRRHFSLRVVLGAGDCEVVDDRTWAARSAPAMARRLPRWLRPRQAAHRGVEVDVPLEGEVEVAPGVTGVPVPGHTRGSYCFVDGTREAAFVGDLVLSFPDGLSRPMRAISADDDAFVASLRRFAAGAPRVGYAGHGPPVSSGFGEALRGLAEQPRDVAPTPARLWRRARRLAWFAYHYSRSSRP